MFDQQTILTYYLTKIEKQTNLTSYSQSAFNQSLDRRLHKLVLMYRFNFEAIALHLTYEFPQYQYKITKDSIAYRWYQLVCQERQKIKQGDQGTKQEIKKVSNKQEKYFNLGTFTNQLKQNQREKSKMRSSSSEDSEQQLTCSQKQRPQSPCKTNSHNKRSFLQLEKALQQAQQSQNIEQADFILYKPHYQKYTQQKLTESNIQALKLIPQANPTESHQPKNQSKKQSSIDAYEYGYDYSQLEQEYNHYNNLINSYGFGYHEDSATNSSIDTSEGEAPLENRQLDDPQNIFTTHNQFLLKNDVQGESGRFKPQLASGGKAKEDKQDFMIHQSDYESD